MGNRAYLIKTNNETSIELFESNNNIPVFWFSLLDLSLIENVENDLINCYNASINDEDNDWEDFPNIKISKPVFIANLNSSKNFIANHYPENLNLYNDFIRYLDKKFAENDTLELNILETANFYTNGMEDLIQEIKNIIQNINANTNDYGSFSPDKSIYTFVGYDKFLENDFQNYSKEYLEWDYNNSNKRKTKQETKGGLLDFILKTLKIKK